MKRLIFLSTLLIFALASTAQPLLIPKGIKASGRIISPTEVSYLDSLSGPIEKTFLKVSDGVLGSTLYYEKDTIDSKLSKKANLYQPALVNPTANTLPVGTNTTGLATTAFVAGQERCIYAYNQQISNTGNTTENTVLTFTIPANSIGANGTFRVNTLVTSTSNTNAKVFRVKFNGSPVCYIGQNTTNNTTRCQFLISNRNSASSQIMGNAANYLGGAYGIMPNAPTLTSINTALDITCTVTLQCSTSGSDYINIEQFCVYATYMP